MKITKNGFYRVSEIVDPDINIEQGLEVFIYDDTRVHPSISIGTDAKLHYISFFQHE